MKISYKTDYALKALLELALRHEDGSGVMSIQEIAEKGDMPKKFLEQILLQLKRGGFVKSKRGIEGGFTLAKDPKGITVGDVIRSIEGPIEPISCIENKEYKGCKDIGRCIFRSIWQDISNAISVVVDTMTFEELIMRYREKRLKSEALYDYVI